MVGDAARTAWPPVGFNGRAQGSVPLAAHVRFAAHKDDAAGVQSGAEQISTTLFTFQGSAPGSTGRHLVAIDNQLQAAEVFQTAREGRQHRRIISGRPSFKLRCRQTHYACVQRNFYCFARPVRPLTEPGPNITVHHGIPGTQCLRNIPCQISA